MRSHPVISRVLVRATVASGAVVLLTLTAACGSDDGDEAEAGGSQLAGVDVSGDPGSEPTVEIDAPLNLEESQTEVVIEGDGDELVAEDQIQLQFALYNGTTGDLVQSSYEVGPQTAALNTEGGLQYLLDALIGRTVGSRVAVGVAPADGFGDELQGATDAPFGPDDTLVYVVDVLDIVSNVAEGDEVTDVPEGLPTVQTGEGDVVTGVEVPGGEPPAELVVQPLIEGDGDPVTAEDTLTVQYWGVLWDGGGTFDASWERGEPATFPLSGVIPCWTEGLAGQSVGSRVLLVCPSDVAYGEEGQPPTIPGGATLVFVVDILAA